MFDQTLHVVVPGWVMNKSVSIITNAPKYEWPYIDGLAQDCSNSIANALGLLQSCTKPLHDLFSSESLCIFQRLKQKTPHSAAVTIDICVPLQRDEDIRCSIHELLGFVRSPGVLHNIGYPSAMHFKLKSHEILFAHNLFHRYLIILTFCTEHDSDTAMLCTKFQNNRMIEKNVMDERDLSYRWVSDGYPVLHSTAVYKLQINGYLNSHHSKPTKHTIQLT